MDLVLEGPDASGSASRGEGGQLEWGVSDARVRFFTVKVYRAGKNGRLGDDVGAKKLIIPVIVGAKNVVFQKNNILTKK